MRGAERGLALGYMRATDPQVLGIQRFVSSYTECLLPLSTSTYVIRLSQARRLPATRERPRGVAQPHIRIVPYPRSGRPATAMAGRTTAHGTRSHQPTTKWLRAKGQVKYEDANMAAAAERDDSQQGKGRRRRRDGCKAG